MDCISLSQFLFDFPNSLSSHVIRRVVRWLIQHHQQQAQRLFAFSLFSACHTGSMNSMFARVLKTQTSQPQPSNTAPPPSPSKLKSSTPNAGAAAAVQPSPSKIPQPVARSSRAEQPPSSPTRESAAAQKENYLAFLQQHHAAQPRAAPAPPKEQYGVPPSRAAVQPPRQDQPLPPLPPRAADQDSDIHMQTVKTVNPAMLRQLAAPQNHYQAARAPLQPQSDDIRMQTARFETRQPQQPQPGAMQLWEKEILDKADTKRKVRYRLLG